MKKREKSNFEKVMNKIQFLLRNVIRPIVNILANISEQYSRKKNKTK